MKSRLAAAIPAAALLFAFPACDGHTWEDSEDGKVKGTKRFFVPHTTGGHAEAGGHEGGAEGAEGGAEGGAPETGE